MKHHPRKRFGQNFLQDRNVVSRIVRAIAPREDQHIVEIGPGKGAMTEQLLAIVKAMDVIELDRDLIPILREHCASIGNLEIHEADALKFDFTSIAKPSKRMRVVGNLPYNISTPLLFHVLDQIELIEDMHFMLQKEVIDRMAAPPGSKTYGRLSVMVQYHCDVEKLFEVSPGAFFPQPSVYSAIVRLIPHRPYPHSATDYTLFAAMVNECFSHRRKTLRNTLKQWLNEAQIQEVGIDPNARPETLSVEQFVNLANAAVAKANRS